MGYYKLEYEARIARATDYIRKNLGKRITLAAVAKAASFSHFHFHRLFTDIVGETPHDFVWRLRAEKAVNILRNSSLPIQEIAFQCGYSNQSNLAKNLKKHYKMTPTQIRLHPEKVIPLGRLKKPKIIPENDYKLQQIEKNIRVEKIPEKRIAYLRGITKGADTQAIIRLWMRMDRWAQRNDLYSQGAENIGIMLDNPTLTHPNQCQYDAAVTIPKNFQVNGLVNERVIPAGEYIAYDFKGSPQALNDCFDRIYRGWFPNSGYFPGDFPPITVIRRNLFGKPKGILHMKILILLGS